VTVAQDLIEAHVTPVLERIRAATGLTEVVFEGDVKGDPPMYVNVFHDTGFHTRTTYVDVTTDVDVTFTIHSVGIQRWQAIWASGRVSAQLIDFKPVVEGRRCWRIASAGSQPVRPDDTVSPLKFLAVDRFTLHSTPA
jgi:hypothetical protein